MNMDDPYRPPTAVGPRNPDGSWTILVDLCPSCGAFAGECDCPEFHMTGLAAPVIHMGPTGARVDYPAPRRSHPATAQRALPAALCTSSTTEDTAQ